MKITKKIVLSILAVLMITVAFSLSVYAEDNIVDFLTYEINNGEVTITGCDQNISGEIVIPDTIEGHPVTVLGESSFLSCFAEKVIIPYGVREIRSFAFGYCMNLEEIVIPESVELIEDSFWNCSLKSVTIPGSVKKIGDYAFLNCQNLENVIISEGVETIGKEVFNCCYSLKNIDLPDSLTTIETYAFAYCEELETIVIPENVKYFGDSIFLGCSSLTNIVLQEGIEVVPVGFYSGIEMLNEDFVLLESVKRIEERAFEYVLFNSVSFSENVEFIGEKAFCNCLFLNQITIYNKDAVIEEKALGYSNIIVTGNKEEFQKAFTELNEALSEENPDHEKIGELQEKLNSSYIYSDELQPDPNFTIYGYKDSTAEDYAKENNIKFVAICEHEYVDTVITSPTETETGIGGKVCTYCGDIVDRYEIPVIKVDNDTENDKPDFGESLSFIDKIIAFFCKIINFFKNIKWLS